MTDLRQGVSPAAHAVLDLLDAEADGWGNAHTLAGQLDEARLAAATAHGHYITHRPLAELRPYAVEAAARLIDAVREIDRCIAAGEK